MEAPQAGGPRRIVDPPGTQSQASSTPTLCVEVGEELAQPDPSWLDPNVTASGFLDLTTLPTPKLPAFTSPTLQPSADADEEAAWRMLLGDSPLPGPTTEEVADFLYATGKIAQTSTLS